MKHIYFHVGMPKTGSTSLQEFLWTNKNTLEEAGVGFFTPKDGAWRELRANAEFLLKGYEIRLPEFAEYAKEYDTLILTEELLWFYAIENPYLWKKVYAIINSCIKEDFIIYPVVYLRRQDEWILSWWKERVNGLHPYLGSFREMLEEQKKIGGLDYSKQLNELTSVFGKDHIIVRIYDRELMTHGDICIDFMDALGLPWNDGYRLGHESNPSLTLDAANAMHLINSGAVPYDSPDKLRLSLRSAATIYSMMFPEKERTHMLDARELAELMSFCEDSNRMVSEDFLEGVPLFSDKIYPYALWEKTPAETLRIAEDLIRLSKTSNKVHEQIMNSLKRQ